jgi:hypothetical protein
MQTPGVVAAVNSVTGNKLMVGAGGTHGVMAGSVVPSFFVVREWKLAVWVWVVGPMKL